MGAVLRVEEEGHVGHDGSRRLSHVQFWGLTGLELFLVTELCQVLLKRLAETESGAHLPQTASLSFNHVQGDWDVGVHNLLE